VSAKTLLNRFGAELTREKMRMVDKNKIEELLFNDVTHHQYSDAHLLAQSIWSDPQYKDLIPVINEDLKKKPLPEEFGGGTLKLVDGNVGVFGPDGRDYYFGTWA
jgi:hypothetical protein